MLDVPTILDIEASGFGSGSYPIEVGYVTSSGEIFCCLIRPAASWSHWDHKAEAVHQIRRDTLLCHGQDIVHVARKLNQSLAGEVVYSDGWANDYSWCVFR